MTKDSILTVDQIEIISESLEITEYADDEA